MEQEMWSQSMEKIAAYGTLVECVCKLYRTIQIRCSRGLVGI